MRKMRKVLRKDNTSETMDECETVMESIRKIQDKLQTIEQKVETASSPYNEDHEDDFTESETSQGERKNEDNDITQVKKTWAQKTKPLTPQFPSKEITGILKRCLAENAKENQHQEERAHHVVIFKAKESTDPDRRNRIEEDRWMLQELMEGLEISPTPIIRDVVRLGKKIENQDRPLRFGVNTLEEKAAIMDNLYKLKYAYAPFKDMVVRHDLTPEQRKEQREKVKEAKDLTERAKQAKEPFLYVVRTAPGPYWEPMIKKIRDMQAGNRQ